MTRADVRRTAAILALVGVAAVTAPSSAGVYHSRESALELAFGAGATVASRELFLSQAEQDAAGERAGAAIPTRLIQRYEGRAGYALLGHAYFETHQVRTLPETLMIVVAPDGTVAAVHVLAFHEPEAYLPHQGFLDQYVGHPLSSELSLRTGIQGIAGSTFTANAVTAAVRRVLAVHQVLAERSQGGD